MYGCLTRQRVISRSKNDPNKSKICFKLKQKLMHWCDSKGLVSWTKIRPQKKTHFIKEISSPLKDTSLTKLANITLMTTDEE